jgi:hypothetical protein
MSRRSAATSSGGHHFVTRLILHLDMPYDGRQTSGRTSNFVMHPTLCIRCNPHHDASIGRLGLDMSHVEESGVGRRWWARSHRVAHRIDGWDLMPRSGRDVAVSPCRRGVLAKLAAVVLAIAVVVVPVAVAESPSAHADPYDESLYEQFYTPPQPLPPGEPGDLIRSEPARMVLEPSGQLGSFVGKGTRIMFRSTDAQGHPVARTGLYIEPDNPWPGNGPRPLLAYSTLLYGMGEQCAPSRMFSQGIHASLNTGFDVWINLDETFVATLLARGFAIVVVDPAGLGLHEPQSPQLLNRAAMGSSLIDGARAAMQLPGTSLDPHGPVAFWGWIMGAQAALAAAEMTASYAPELHVVGTYAAASPTNLSEAVSSLDGNFFAGAAGWLLRGIMASYPELEQPIWDSLTPRGIEMLSNTGDQCTLQMGIDYMFRHYEFWFKNDIYQTVNVEPFKTVLAAQRLGNVKPTGPVYFEHNRWDSFAPYTSAHDTARDYCAKGADVTFWTNEQPPFLNKLDINSFLPEFVDGERSMAWITDRFNGVPTASNCDEIQADG